MALTSRVRFPAVLKPFTNIYGRLWRRQGVSTKPDKLRPDTSQRARARIERITSRLPKFLRGYTALLVDAPLSHILAFLMLHEFTAVVPLFTLAGTFHYTQWLPTFLEEGKRVADGVDRFSKYFRKRGWLEEEQEGQSKLLDGKGSGTRVIVEFATAYAVTKALLPLRLVLSVWATPWFARVAILPGTRLLRRMYLLVRKP